MQPRITVKTSSSPEECVRGTVRAGENSFAAQAGERRSFRPEDLSVPLPDGTVKNVGTAWRFFRVPKKLAVINMSMGVIVDEK